MADLSVMRLRDDVLCSCGAEITPGVRAPHSSPSRPTQCTDCRHLEAVESALASRRALTDLVAHERGYALHRRVLPESGSVLDHLFVGAGGVFVIDSAYHPDADVSVERTGGRFAAGSETLTVGGRRRPELLHALRSQCAEVTAGLAGVGQADVPVIPVICFVEGHLPRRARHRRVGDVRLVGPLTLADEVGADGQLDADRRFAIAMALVAFLPSA